MDVQQELLVSNPPYSPIKYREHPEWYWKLARSPDDPQGIRVASVFEFSDCSLSVCSLSANFLIFYSTVQYMYTIGQTWSGPVKVGSQQMRKFADKQTIREQTLRELKNWGHSNPLWIVGGAGQLETLLCTTISMTCYLPCTILPLVRYQVSSKIVILWVEIIVAFLSL